MDAAATASAANGDPAGRRSGVRGVPQPVLAGEMPAPLGFCGGVLGGVDGAGAAGDGVDGAGGTGAAATATATLPVQAVAAFFGRAGDVATAPCGTA